MAVDFVEPTIADLPDAPGGALALLTDELRLAVKIEQGGDWVPLMACGSIWEKIIAAPASLANGASADVAVDFPPGLFTQAPAIAITPSTTRYNVAVKPGTESIHGFTLRVSNFSGANSGDATPAAHIVAVQTLGWAN